MRAERIAITPRQAEAVEFVAQGLPYKQIAHRMGISPYTVEDFVYEVAARLRGNGTPRERIHRWYWMAHPERPFRIITRRRR